MSSERENTPQKTPLLIIPLLRAPLLSMLPREDELGLVGNPLMGSFDAVGAAGRPANPTAGC